MKRLLHYIEDIDTGVIASCIYVKQAVQRFKDNLQRADLYFDEEKVQRVIDFIGLLQHSTGKFDNEPFILSDWQIFIVANIYGITVKETGNRLYKRAYIEMARKQGKALSLDTQIPTLNGYTTMGQLQVGDKVLGQDGKETNVTFVTPIQYDRECYNVTFEDGEVITADAEHQWLVKTKKTTRVRTTQQLLNFKHDRADGKGTEYKFRVPMPEPMEFEHKELSINPYVLGLWLGDGSSAKPNFTVNEADLSMYDELVPTYGNYKIYRDKRRPSTLDVSFAGDIGKGKNNSLLRNQLVDLGVFNNKHIPLEYLRGSYTQRLQLLQGLMDTDGSVSNGQCEFIQESTIITDGLCELLSTLGIKYTRTTKIPTIKGVACNPVQRVQFYTDKTNPCFRLERKFNVLKDKLNDRMLYKSIINIEKIDSVPVKCITVDNADSLYLVGKKYTTTHNTAFMAALGLYHLMADGEAGAEVILAANSREQANTAFDMCSNFATKLDSKKKYFKPYRASLRFPATKSVLKVIAADAKKQDGFNCSFGIVDEYHAAKDSGILDVIGSSMLMREQPLLAIITTAGFNKISPCYQYRETSIEILEGLKTDDNLFTIIYTLDANDDWQDEDVWEKCSPNLGVTVTKEAIQQEITKAINNVDEEVGVKTKTLNLWTDVSEVWITSEAIMRVSKDLKFEDFKGSTCFVGVDLASTQDLTAIAYLWEKKGKLYVKVKYYIPSESLQTRMNKEKYKIWNKQKLLTSTIGNVTDYDAITNDLLINQKQFKIGAVAYDSWNATQWAIKATELRLPLEPFSQTVGNFNSYTRELERLILSEGIVIDNNEILRWNFANVLLKTDYNGNVKPSKGSGEALKIDGVIAIIQALAMYMKDSAKLKTKIY